MLVVRKKIKLSSLPSALNGMKICHISDVHLVRLGRLISPILNAVKRENPDIILITGDLISRITKDFSLADKMLCGLSSIAPVFLSLGNHECDLDASKRSQFDKICLNANVTLLDNHSHEFYFNGESFIIAGFTAPIGCYHDEEFGFNNLLPCEISHLTDALGVKKSFTILLAHNPLFFDAYAKWGAELTLSGHVHGGVIRLPFLGGILSPERKFFPKYYSGEYKLGKNKMYVSTGLGKLRLFNPSEVIFLTLES